MTISFKQYLTEQDTQVFQLFTKPKYSHDIYDVNDCGTEENEEVTDKDFDLPKSKEEKHKQHHKAEVNPDKAGLIRRIKGAHLVYKRQMPDDTYEELWMYNIERGIKDEQDIRSAILAGTDINVRSGNSESGKQKFDLWTNNNVQMLHITGLPN
jgi:hypothetical protein